MEQLLIAQREHEVAVYRDTSRLVTIFGIAFAAIGVIALLAAGYLNFRSMAAMNAATPLRASFDGQDAPARGLLPSGGKVSGMERVQASGQRFQTRMSSLEQRLAELEHIAGREPAAVGSASLSPPAPAHTDEAGPATSVETEITEAPRRVIPRAAILVHKAQTLMNLGKLDEALATLDDAAAIDGARGDVHLARGQVLEKLGRLGDALHAYEIAVEREETSTSALLMKAGVLNRQERFTEALQCYERALEVSRAGT